MFGVLFLTLSLTLVCASDRRLVNQINNLKEDLSYVNSDISSLFQHFDMLNKTIWSNVLGSSMKSREEHVLERIGELSDKESSTAMLQHEVMNLIKGLHSEKKLNRRLLERLEAAENRLEAAMNTRNTELTNMLESTNRLNLQLSEQVITVEQSNTDLRIELSQLKIDYGAVQDELSELKAQLQIDNESMKGEFLVLAENVSKITKSCECITKNTPNDVTLQTSTLIMQDRETSTSVPVPTSCKDQQTSGVYDIFIENSVKTSVYCDADTDGGGWIVIFRRLDGSVDFDRKSDEYKNGFGVVDGEFWIGNEVIHQLTKFKPLELRVDMEDVDGDKRFAKYAVFKVGSEADKYVLTVSGYSGTAGDSLEYYNGMKFSTLDQDNDRYWGGNCAREYGGGWWYNDCGNVMLTGTRSTGKLYMGWFYGDRWRNLKFAEMKIR